MRRLTISTKPKIELNLTDIERAGKPEAISASLIEVVAPSQEFDIRKPRMSSIYKACMRMHVLGTLSKLKKTERLTFSRFLTYFIGQAVHFRIQNTPELLGKNRYGWWKCTACHKRRGFSRVSYENCKHCGASYKAAVYEEHAIDLAGQYPCTGHPDMFVKMSDQLRVLEIKTIKTSDYKQLIAPQVGHSWQVQGYLWACSEDKELPAVIDPNVGYITYLPKEEVSTYPKTFVVPRDERIVAKIKAKLTSYYEGVEHGKIPAPLPACAPKFTGSVAGWCPCNTECRRNYNENH